MITMTRSESARAKIPTESPQPSRLYWCPRCDFLTGAQLQSSPVPHKSLALTAGLREQTSSRIGELP